MNGIVYLNGKYVAAEDANISAFDRGFIFGDGVYEVLPIIEGHLIDKNNCMQRLKNSLHGVNLQWPFSQSECLNILNTLIKLNSVKEGTIYLQITRGIAQRDFAFPKEVAPTCFAFVSHKDLINDPLQKTGVSVVTTDDLRWKKRDIKSIALLPQCLAKQEAKSTGAYEGWMVEDGYVTEGTSSSAYIVKDKTIITRPLSRSILPGIRRKSLLSLAKKEGIQINERLFSVAEAYEADEAFMSSASTIVLPIIKINNTVIGNGKPGPFSIKMRELYIKMAKSEIKCNIKSNDINPTK